MFLSTYNKGTLYNLQRLYFVCKLVNAFLSILWSRLICSPLACCLPCPPIIYDPTSSCLIFLGLVLSLLTDYIPYRHFNLFCPASFTIFSLSFKTFSSSNKPIFFFIFQDITFANNLNKHFRTLKILSIFFSLFFHPIRNLKFTHWTSYLYMNHIQSTENGFFKDAFWITQTCQVCMRFHCCPCSDCFLIREWLQIEQSLPVMCMSLFALNCQSHYITTSLFSATPRHVFSKIPFSVVPNSVICWYMWDYIYFLPPWSFVKQVQSGIHEYILKDFFMIFSLQ